MSVTPADPPAPEPTGASTHPNGFVGWLEEHILPGMKEAAASAEKGKKVAEAVSAFLPKVTALAEKEPALAAEAEQLLAIIEAL